MMMTVTSVRTSQAPPRAARSQTAGETAPNANDGPDDKPEHAFARLALLVASNDRLLAELKSIRQQVERAAAYAISPGANRTLAKSCLDRLRDRRSQVLALLRANRILAREFLSA